ncbi:uncharacterized protein LOC113495888 [Trichoplusia ni]|uniref:Uncharacterized protein LOC113495888 n=1 Tax=Trichoplusia ni TaxID=7111 RepID=A0A7E5VQS0_TRINI|nr:uncharacterized protein LOC113495888 [Trichoplusia ni]
MTSKLVVICLLLTFAASLVHARGNIALGNASSADLIFHEIYERYSFPLLKRNDDVKVTAQGRERIKAIRVSDLNGNGKSYIIEGGIGSQSVTIRLESNRGEGYKFLVEVYAR